MDPTAPGCSDATEFGQDPNILSQRINYDQNLEPILLQEQEHSAALEERKRAASPDEPSPIDSAPPPPSPPVDVPSPPRLPHRQHEGRSYVDAPPVPFFFHPPIYPPPSPSRGTSRSPKSRRTTRRGSVSTTSLEKHALPTAQHMARLSSTPAHEKPSSIVQSLLWQMRLLVTPRPIRRSFVRTTDTVIRATLAFVVAAVIAVQPWSTEILAIPYLFAMFTAGTVRPTVGSTVFYIDSQGKGVLAAAVLDVLITAAQIQQLESTTRIVVSEVLLFVTSTLLAYYFHPPLSRRFSLACHTLILVQIANGNTHRYLPMQIFLCFALSYIISFFLVLLPFPRLARDELLDRYQQSLTVLSSVYMEVIASYLNTEPIAPAVWSVTAQSQLDAVSKSVIQMRRLQGETKHESDLFSWLFPKSISVACPVAADVDGVEELYWTATNFMHTLSILKFSTAHAAFVHFLRDSLNALATEQHSFLVMLSDEKTHHVTQRRLTDHKQRMQRCMQHAWRDYGIAREHVYGSKEESKVGNKPDSRPAPPPAPTMRHQRRFSLSRADTLRALSIPVPTPMDSGAADATMDETVFETDPLLAAAVVYPSSTSLYHTTNDVFVRSCFFFYVSRFHAALQAVQLNQPNPHSAATPPTRSAPTSPTSKSPPPSRKRDKWHSIRESFLHHLRHPLSWSLAGFHPVRDASSLVRGLVHFVRHPSVDYVWLRGCLKIALIICTASIIAVTPQTNTSLVFPNALWAAFTAAILTSDTEGALWQRAIHRVLGTMVGGLVGYLIILAFPNGTWYGEIPLLSLWCVPMLYVQFSAYSYLGSMAQLTPIVIVFGYTLTASGSNLTPERYALARMEEIVIGVAIALGISTLLWPVSSVALLRSEIIVSIESFKAGIARTINVYEQMALRQERRVKEWVSKRQHSDGLLQTGSANLMQTGSSNLSPRDGGDAKAADDVAISVEQHDVCRNASAAIEDELAEQNAALQSLFSTTNSVQLSLSRQYRLLAEAVNEPTFFFSPFPTAQYSLITRTERRIWCLIITIEPALEQILEQHKRALTDDGKGGYGRLGELEEEEALFDVSAIRTDIQLMSREMATLLSRSVEQLQSGRTEQSPQLEAVVCIVQAVEAAFATSMNEMAARVRQGHGRLLRSEQMVPIAVFLYSAAQLAEQVLVLDSAVRRLLELEQPTTYDD